MTSFQAFLLWPLDHNQLVFMFHTFHAISPLIGKTMTMRQRSGIWDWQLRYGTVFDHRKDRHFFVADSHSVSHKLSVSRIKFDINVKVKKKKKIQIQNKIQVCGEVS